MYEYKPYGPWHRLARQPRTEPRSVQILVWGIITLIVGLLIVMTVEAIDKQMQIDEAYNAGKRDMRMHILNANKDILKGHERYIKEMDAIIEREYRSKR